MSSTAVPDASAGLFQRSRSFDSKVWLPIAVALVVLACYWLTLAPTVTEGDAGELATAVHVMGVAHPTGYPLYLMVGKLFDLLPLGEPARRIAFFSAVSAAAAAGLVCWMVLALTSSLAAGALGGLSFGFSWWVWRHANDVEVYALNLFLICLLSAMFVRWLRQPQARRLNQLAFCCGLAITHHRMSAFFVAPLLVVAAAVTYRQAPERLLKRTVAFLLLPLLLYLWLPLRSAARPPVNWGFVSGSFDNFIYHVTARAYYRYALADTFANGMAAVGSYLVNLWRQFTPLGCVLAAIGVVGMARAPGQRRLGLSFAAIFVMVTMWAAVYLVPDKKLFFAPTIIPVAAWCGAGLDHAARGLRKLLPSVRRARLVSAAAVVVAAALPLNMARINWRVLDRSQQYGVLEAATVEMAGVPRDALVVVNGDPHIFRAYYYWYVLHPESAPTILAVNLMGWTWYDALIDPRIGSESEQLQMVPVYVRPVVATVIVRRNSDPRWPVYADCKLHESRVPLPFVLLKDYLLDRLVLPPGIPQSADAPGTRLLLQFSGGGLLSVALPAETARGRPFPITAAIRHSVSGAARGDLVFQFARSDCAGEVAAGNWGAVSSRLKMDRRVPVLFGAAPGACGPGRHYDQTFYAIFPRRLRPGSYEAFVRLAPSQYKLPPVRLGSIAVR